MINANDYGVIYPKFSTKSKGNIVISRQLYTGLKWARLLTKVFLQNCFCNSLLMTQGKHLQSYMYFDDLDID